MDQVACGIASCGFIHHALRWLLLLCEGITSYLYLFQRCVMSLFMSSAHDNQVFSGVCKVILVVLDRNIMWDSI